MTLQRKRIREPRWSSESEEDFSSSTSENGSAKKKEVIHPEGPDQESAELLKELVEELKESVDLLGLNPSSKTAAASLRQAKDSLSP